MISLTCGWSNRLAEVAKQAFGTATSATVFGILVPIMRTVTLELVCITHIYKQTGRGVYNLQSV